MRSPNTTCAARTIQTLVSFHNGQRSRVYTQSHTTALGGRRHILRLTIASRLSPTQARRRGNRPRSPCPSLACTQRSGLRGTRRRSGLCPSPNPCSSQPGQACTYRTRNVGERTYACGWEQVVLWRVLCWHEFLHKAQLVTESSSTKLRRFDTPADIPADHQTNDCIYRVRTAEGCPGTTTRLYVFDQVLPTLARKLCAALRNLGDSENRPLVKRLGKVQAPTSMMSISPVAAHTPRDSLAGSIQKAPHKPRPRGSFILASILPVRNATGLTVRRRADVYVRLSTCTSSLRACSCGSCQPQKGGNTVSRNVLR